MIDSLFPAFWNNQERRLRAGWRLVLQMDLFLISATIPSFFVMAVGKESPWAPADSAISVALCLGVIWIVGRFLDRRRIKDYGYHLTWGWWTDFGFGLLLGAVLMTGVFLTERLAGWIDVSAPVLHEGAQAWGRILLLSVPLFFGVALNEEFMSRGYQLRNFAEGIVGRRMGPRAAIVIAWLISSSLFGVFHILNPNATGVSTLNIMLAGLLLGLPYILTGELAISIGLHLTWNLFQGTVYGFPVSGSKLTKGLVVLEQAGPDVWTGGKFGPEGGLLGIAAMIVGFVLVVAWVNLRGRLLAIETAVARYEPRRPAIAANEIPIAAQAPAEGQAE
jgi:uncharacterized protein